MRTLLLLSAAVLTIPTATITAQKNRIRDAIVKTDGSRVRGVEVIAMTAAAVTFKKGSTEDKVAADRVVRVEWYEPPEAFVRAAGEERRGDHQTAANLYLEAAENTERQPLKEEAMFLGARAQLRAAGTDAGKAGIAADALQRYLSAAPQGFRAPEARLLLGRAQRLQGNAPAAEATLNELENAVISEGWPLVWDVKAKFERALALIAQNKTNDARNAYRAVVAAVDALGDATTPELTQLRALAVVGEGETYLSEGELDRALQFFRQHARGPSGDGSTVLQAAALAGMGQALFLKAEADGSSGIDTLRDAQVALAQAQVLDSSNGEAAAKAGYFSGKVLLALGDDQEKQSKARAQFYFQLVAKYYPTTRWAARAREELSN